MKSVIGFFRNVLAFVIFAPVTGALGIVVPRLTVWFLLCRRPAVKIGVP